MRRTCCIPLQTIESILSRFPSQPVKDSFMLIYERTMLVLSECDQRCYTEKDRVSKKKLQPYNLHNSHCALISISMPVQLIMLLGFENTF
jgi:hypothetical protein